MHESTRNRLLKWQRAFLLAASDMDHSRAAAEALDREGEDVALMRALETAIAVCYARAFTASSLLRLDEHQYRPDDQTLGDMHGFLCDLRDTVYAHTDKQGGRAATMAVQSATGLGNLSGLPEAVGLEWEETWYPLPREALPAALSLFALQQDRFRREAAAIQLQLDGLMTVDPRQPWSDESQVK